MERLNVLRDKVEALLRSYSGLKAELEVKDKVLQEKEEELAMLRDQLKKAEERLLALEIGKAVPDAESRTVGRKQLDAVIGEIDKILMLLHD